MNRVAGFNYPAQFELMFVIQIINDD